MPSGTIRRKDTAGTITNLLANPSGETSLGWTSNSAIQCTGTWDPTFALVGSQSRKWVHGTDPAAQPATIINAYGIGAPIAGVTTAAKVAVTAGTTYTVSCWFYTPVSGLYAAAIAYTYDASNALITALTQTQRTFTAGAWQRLSWTYTMPASTAYFFFGLSVARTDGATVNPTDAVWTDAAMMTLGSTLYDYFDGSFTSDAFTTHAWTGTLHASMSTKTVLTDWVDLTQVGATGPAGPVGATGSTGATGAANAAQDIQTFTSSGTWTKPANAKAVEVILIGGGGGGGSGRRGGAASTRCGGGGGAGGGMSRLIYPAAALAPTVAVTVGTGGAGAAGQSTATTNGNTGTTGNDSSFGDYARALGGGPGVGGTPTSGVGGTGGVGMWSGSAGGAASTSGGLPAAGLATTASAAGGSGGAGITSADATTTGNVGGSQPIFSDGTPSGGLAGAAGGGAGAVGTAQPTNSGAPGHGGGGGGSSTASTGGAGGNGGIYGAGGGGGSASVNPFNSGAGGTGGAGICVVTTSF